ncbi:MAG: class I SAM-dependent methyltransferase [Verrucomicrobiota bacterium]
MSRWITSELFAAFEAGQTTAHRLATFADAWVERLGADVLISFKNDAARDRALNELREWEVSTGFKSARVFSRFLPKQNAERIAPVLIEGDAATPLTAVVMENGVRYGIDFAAGYSAGLFIDQRANRSFLRQLAPKRALNTFAYTCSFSVVAALAGAEAVSVDLSKKSIDRGRENFELNGIPTSGHRFLADDVLDVLPRLERRGEKFDAIILDPPTFSRGNRGRRWQVEQDLEKLVSAALELASPNASLLISTNCTRLDRRALESIARFCLKSARRGGDFHQEPPPPDFPAGAGAQTLWVALR